MKILLLEYVTGGGMRQEAIPPSLGLEGGRMRQALACDLLAPSASLPGVELIILHDDRLPPPRLDGPVHVVAIGADDPFQAIWREWLGCCDAAWPIAPETGGILARLCLDAETAGIPLLTSPSSAVHLAASKLATARHLALSGLLVAHTLPLSAWTPQTGQPFVVKPDDGAGCEGARIIRDPAQFQPPSSMQGWIAQPLLEGEPLSLSALFAHGQARLLSCNRQRIVQAGDGFKLKGCQVNAIADVDGRWQALAAGIARALPGLWGYAGIDLILGADGPVILEINPRLTTSYAGLRQAIGENPAAWVLDLWQTGQLPGLRSHTGLAVDVFLE